MATFHHFFDYIKNGKSTLRQRLYATPTQAVLHLMQSSAKLLPSDTTIIKWWTWNGQKWVDGNTLRSNTRVGGIDNTKSWYRLHYLDVITENDAFSPNRQLTDKEADAWQKRRQQPNTNVLVILQRFYSGVGWRTT